MDALKVQRVRFGRIYWLNMDYTRLYYLGMSLLYLQRGQVLIYTACHVSTAAQKGQTKPKLYRGPFTFFTSFMPTLGYPTCLEGRGER